MEAFARPWKVNTEMGTILCAKLYQRASAKFSKQFIKAHWRWHPKFSFVKRDKAGDLIKTHYVGDVLQCLLRKHVANLCYSIYYTGYNGEMHTHTHTQMCTEIPAPT